MPLNTPTLAPPPASSIARRLAGKSARWGARGWRKSTSLAAHCRTMPMIGPFKNDYTDARPVIIIPPSSLSP